MILSGLSATAQYYTPPETIHRDVRMFCDIDGDGVTDLIENAYQVPSQPSAPVGSSTIFARSGADGREIWRAEGLFFFVFNGERGTSLVRPGLPDPQAIGNVVLTDDWTDDGVCDLFTWGMRGRPGGISTPFFGSPSLTFTDVEVRLLDGTTGNETWRIVRTQESATANEVFLRTVIDERHAGLPTDLRVLPSSQGKQILLRTTDITFNQVQDGFGFVEFVLQNEIWSMEATFQEHYTIFNKTGEEIWSHDSIPSGNETQLSWISGLEDVNGDGYADIIVDQARMSNPRSSEMAAPTGDEPYKNGRAMTVLAIDGNPNGTGATLWSREVHPLQPVEAQADNEEGIEMLTWTHARLLPDVTGDGVAEVAAQWLGIEEAAATSVDGAARTHFWPLDGATGQPLWDAQVQGWGFLHSLGPDVWAAATSDIPSENTGVGLLPKSARIVGFDGETGENLWAHEQEQKGGDSSYGLTQWQWFNALGTDTTGDGVVDPFMPPRALGSQGSEQVFRATARMAFDRLDGKTGEVMNSYETWGLDGIMADCGDGIPTAFVGHSERLELVRWEDEGLLSDELQPTASQVLWATAQPGSSSLGVALVTMGGHCKQHGEDLFFATNMERFSFWRQFELFPSFGVVDSQGLRWSLPDTAGMDLSASLLHDAALLGGRFIQSTMELVAAMAIAVVVAAATALMLAPTLRRRRAAARRRKDPLGIMLIVFLIPTPGLIGGVDDAGTGLANTDVELPDLPDLEKTTPSAASAQQAPPTIPPATPATATSKPAAKGTHPSPPALAVPQLRNLSLPDGGLAIPGGGPMSHFLTSLTSSHAQPRDVALSFLAATMGQAQPIDPLVEPSNSLTFNHILGDVDGDGIDDVAVDLYCTYYRVCAYGSPNILDPVAWLQWFMADNYCGPYHTLVAVSGATGTPLWDVRLTEGILTGYPNLTECAVHAVIGTVQTNDGPAILAQSFHWNRPALWGAVYFEHEVYLLDGATGSRRWSVPFEGFLADDLIYDYVADTMLVKPHLSVPKGNQPDLQGIETPQLLVQGIGFVASWRDTLFSPPGANRAVEVLDAYYPNEWMAGIDLETGEVTYRQAILTPTPGRSMVPWPSLVAPFSTEDYGWFYTVYPDQVPEGWQEMAWNPMPCCPDVDGDGIADLVTVTREWRDIRTVDSDGRQGFGAGAIAWSGADGSQLFHRIIIEDVEAPSPNGRIYYANRDRGLSVEIRSAGDVDGDGGMDLVVQLRMKLSDYEDQIHVIDGDTGETFWSQPSMRWQELHTLGDVDGDGGQDFIFMHWWTQENTATIYGDGHNVTARGVRVLDGDTGDLIRTTMTYSAPFDLQAIYGRIQLAGFPDVDGDGVGDYPVDDPIFLADGLLLHQTSWISGRTGSTISVMPTAGAFAFPSRLPDMTGDGIDDVAMIAGDSMDLWLVYHDGRTGQAFSSHRIMATEITSYASLLPKAKIEAIDTGGAAPGVLVSMHLDMTVVEFEYVYYDGDGRTYREFYLDDITASQVLYIQDTATGYGWSFPDAHDAGAHEAVGGSTPGTQALLEIRKEAEPTPAEIGRDLARETWPIAAAFILSFAIVLATAVYVPRRSTS